ncbi:MAG: YlzJ-like family protein [Firmicutes bacterium]|nr:YlzJ-like family protein [Bacillota bacterium]
MSVLHTVMPLSVVLEGAWVSGPLPYGTGVPGSGPAYPAAAGGGMGAVEMVALGEGRFLEVQTGAAGRSVVRLHSSRPADYLDPRFQPGAPWRG